jgi:hypothetical protein
MKNKLKFLLLGLTLTACVSKTEKASLKFQRNDIQKIKVGRFESRALWSPTTARSGAVIMLPGTGPQGPEEMVPGIQTLDGKNAPLFEQLASPFIEAGFNVLALGKPGVDFYSDDPVKKFYNIEMIENLTWQDLLENAQDGIDFLKKQDSVDVKNIYILGHSEGTQLATDLSKRFAPKGLILLGYSGEDLLTTLSWQLIDRGIDHFIKTDVDSDKDGFVTKREAERWPRNFAWEWKPGEGQVSVEEIRSASRNEPKIKQIIEATRKSHFCSNGGRCDRGPIYEETVQFGGSIHAFTGEHDLQTRPGETLKLGEACKLNNKMNCYVEIVPNFQHGFSAPRGPRHHPLLDLALGPVDPSFQNRLFQLAKEIYPEGQVSSF